MYLHFLNLCLNKQPVVINKWSCPVCEFYGVPVAAKFTPSWQQLWLRICVCLNLCFHMWVCMNMYFWFVAHSFGPWPFNLYSFWTASSHHSAIWRSPPAVIFTTPHWHPEVKQEYCIHSTLGRQQGEMEMIVYKWHLALIKSSTCWSTWSAGGLASTVTQAGPLILR